MSRSVEEQLASIQRSLNEPELPQGRAVKPGDPQRVALVQYLMTSSLGPQDILVDLGSGKGALITELLETWPKSNFPRYCAVDLAEPLQDLAMPPAVHNRSFKIVFSEFLSKEISRLREEIGLVVIRNVFHELNITDTARVLSALASQLKPDTPIYIQDFEQLSKPEKGNAGWDQEIFASLLKETGFSCAGHAMESHGGTKWFVILAKTAGKPIELKKAISVCAEKRKLQKEKLLAQQPTLNDPSSAPQYMLSALEISHIELQLGELNRLSPEISEQSLQVAGETIFIRPGARPQLALLTKDSDQFASEAGLIGMIQNKDALDIPELIAQSQSSVLFAGYSLKYMFLLPENISAFCKALSRGVSIRLLISDPDSEIVALRNIASVYKAASQIKLEIQETLIAGRKVCAEAEFKDAVKSGLFGLKTSRLIPPASYFIIDELCFFSLYTQELSGSLAPCAIVKRTNSPHVGFYEVLRRDFDTSFAQGTDALGQDAIDELRQ